MSAIVFTKTITFSYKISVVSVKFLISQNPNIPTHFVPGIIGFTSPLESDKFLPITSEPASPNPKARRAEILINVSLRI